MVALNVFVKKEPVPIALELVFPIISALMTHVLFRKETKSLVTTLQMVLNVFATKDITWWMVDGALTLTNVLIPL